MCVRVRLKIALFSVWRIVQHHKTARGFLSRDFSILRERVRFCSDEITSDSRAVAAVAVIFKDAATIDDVFDGKMVLERVPISTAQSLARVNMQFHVHTETKRERERQRSVAFSD